MERWMDCKIDETPVITSWTRMIYFLGFITIIRSELFFGGLFEIAGSRVFHWQGFTNTRVGQTTSFNWPTGTTEDNNDQYAVQPTVRDKLRQSPRRAIPLLSVFSTFSFYSALRLLVHDTRDCIRRFNTRNLQNGQNDHLNIFVGYFWRLEWLCSKYYKVSSLCL